MVVGRFGFDLDFYLGFWEKSAVFHSYYGNMLMLYEQWLVLYSVQKLFWGGVDGVVYGIIFDINRR